MKKGGEFYWVQAAIAPFKDGAGKGTQYVALRTDIIERETAKEALRLAKTEAEDASNELQETVYRLPELNTLEVERELWMISRKPQINEFYAELGLSPLQDLSFLQAAVGLLLRAENFEHRRC